MSNGTTVTTPELMRERLNALVGAYRGQLQADERRLQQAMLDYERDCWAKTLQHAA